MEKIKSALPKLEALYNSRGDGCYYKLQQSNERGAFLVATREIQTGEVILIERPLGKQPSEPTPALLQQREVAPLLETMQRCARTHGHLTGTSRYPPEVRHALDRLTELQTKEFVLKSPDLGAIWKLADSHRCAEKGDRVMIDGLKSDAGQKLNGLEGQVVGIDEKDKHRLAVELSTNNSKGTKSNKKSIKRENLKTLGGILRTNAFVDNHETTMLIFKDLSRINHACGDAANVIKICDEKDRAFVLARCDIASGQELLIDYIPGEKEEDRLDYLQMKYNFRCQCKMHTYM
ncbi:expressed unknown protein [Seminavis robusta]|uniref:SET domain-containing protein n=1 Tax=Seminavis robusta TaxID=568900 RepID=A0A9N8DFZ3_9STRA|nr:expressed unknown protein [Seminavis robusta]|eukprot:Sro49_g028830.1 n/a (291) ;mRNA; r:129497-130369